MDVRVRLAREEDISDIERCYLRSWRAAYRDDLADERLEAEVEQRRSFDWARGIGSCSAAVLVAVDGPAVVGVVQADLELPAPRDLPEITMVYVDPSAWGRGVGPTLLRHGLAWIAGEGRRAARVRVVDVHRRARRFYEEAGFVLDPALEPVHNDAGFRLIYYRTDLVG